MSPRRARAGGGEAGASPAAKVGRRRAARTGGGPPPARRSPESGPARDLRRILLLIPAAWRAGPRGLAVEEAARLIGVRGAAEVRALVEAVDTFSVGLVESEEVFTIDLEGERVVLGNALKFVRPPPFSLREGAALVAVLRPFERGGGKTVERVLGKLRRAVPDRLRPRAEELARAMDFQVDPPGEWADALQEAIDRRLEVELTYRAAVTGELGARAVEPRLLFHRDGHWYLAAFVPAKAEEHLFRLDRVAEVVLGTRVFGDHRGPPVERYRRRHLYFEGGGEREVTIRLRGPSAAQALELGTDGVAAAGDGEALLRTRVTPGAWLDGWVLGHGGEAIVEAPPEDRARLRERVRELSRLYAGAPTTAAIGNRP